jgi:hypothetical protein
LAIAGMAGFIVLLHVVGWGVLAGLVAPKNYELGSAGVFGIGLGLTAYLLGMRHAFDADHDTADGVFMSAAYGRSAGLRRFAGPGERRLRHRGVVRAHLGRRAGGLAFRPHRGAVARRRPGGRAGGARAAGSTAD